MMSWKNKTMRINVIKSMWKFKKQTKGLAKIILTQMAIKQIIIGSRNTKIKHKFA